jgi:hypothetical protein
MSYELSAHSTASAQKLFTLISDGSRWSEWARPIVMTSSWAKTGHPTPDGIGAVRRVGMWPIRLREETVAYERDRLHAYTMRSPVPMRDYLAEVRFTPTEDGGTDVTWSGGFTERFPGTGRLVAVSLRAMIRALLRRLIAAAER